MHFYFYIQDITKGCSSIADTKKQCFAPQIDIFARVIAYR